MWIFVFWSRQGTGGIRIFISESLLCSWANPQAAWWSVQSTSLDNDMTTRKTPGGARIAFSLALALAAGAAQADATLEKIKERGTITIGVLANGGVFGSLDPATQQLVGWNPELARELAWV
jgi:hypothetical protein